ncbi:hypothetical protein B0H16DRAFT_1446466 [Mycena metata]|uniref:Uncharacterized protein n=1 Tax=Mycena metata TaxID=1033252 RepID=A0AAD7KJ16_9AGAR|nr:hypothetical protein B0H16DRAFT_1446466 [Mycena metata]
MFRLSRLTSVGPVWRLDQGLDTKPEDLRPELAVGHILESQPSHQQITIYVYAVSFFMLDFDLRFTVDPEYTSPTQLNSTTPLSSRIRVSTNEELHSAPQHNPTPVEISNANPFLASLRQFDSIPPNASAVAYVPWAEFPWLFSARRALSAMQLLRCMQDLWRRQIIEGALENEEFIQNYVRRCSVYGLDGEREGGEEESAWGFDAHAVSARKVRRGNSRSSTVRGGAACDGEGRDRVGWGGGDGGDGNEPAHMACVAPHPARVYRGGGDE